MLVSFLLLSYLLLLFKVFPAIFSFPIFFYGRLLALLELLGVLLFGLLLFGLLFSRYRRFGFWRSLAFYWLLHLLVSCFLLLVF